MISAAVDGGLPQTAAVTPQQVCFSRGWGAGGDP